MFIQEDIGLPVFSFCFITCYNFHVGTYMEKKKHRGLKIALICVCSFLAFILAFVGGFLIFASATTLKVKDVEDMPINGEIATKVDKNQEIKLLTWNVGYGALDERQDCYWDGGTGVVGESKEVVKQNIDAISTKISEEDPDIFFIQEIDVKSKRSYKLNELNILKDNYAIKYNNSYACNFKAGFIPLPLYNPFGRVEGGITSFSKYQLTESKRIQLPIPFSWPMKLLNLKRCLLINRSPIEGSDKELVMINLHLEAYDDGEGKAKQLKQLMDIMEEEYAKGNYVIAGGDFNQCFSNVDLTKYPKMNDWVCPIIDVTQYPNFTFNMDDSVPTCRSLYKTYFDNDHSYTSFQHYMLDGFITSNNITVNSLETLDLGFKNTDHNPVVMKINLN